MNYFLDRIFRRWDIGTSGRVSFIQCSEAAKIARALRVYLPTDGYINVNMFIGWQVRRLAEALHRPAILTAIAAMSGNERQHQIDVAKLRQALLK